MASVIGGIFCALGYIGAARRRNRRHLRRHLPDIHAVSVAGRHARKSAIIRRALGKLARMVPLTLSADAVFHRKRGAWRGVRPAYRWSRPAEERIENGGMGLPRQRLRR